MPRTFLTARWQNLVILTYAVPQGLLRPRLPQGLELDDRGGEVYASLVAFDFRDCRVRGLRVPTLTNFPEVNLRFYVREPHSGRRGVVFIREFVPIRVIAWVARAVYNEPYDRAAMRSHVAADDGRVRVEHTLTARGGATLQITAEADAACTTPGESTADHFFKEHSWGFGADRRGRTLVYEVRHPVWDAHCSPSAEVTGDCGAIYGKGWEFLSRAAPAHVMVAVGSNIEVCRHSPLA